MTEMATRMHAALNACLDLPAGSRPLLVSHGMALGALVSTILGLPAYAERRLRLRNCSLSRVDYQQSAWLAEGWIVETAGIFPIWMRLHSTSFNADLPEAAVAMTAALTSAGYGLAANGNQIFATDLGRWLSAFFTAIGVKAFDVLSLTAGQPQRRHAGAVEQQDKLLQIDARAGIGELHVVARFQNHVLPGVQVNRAVSRHRRGVENLLLIIFFLAGAHLMQAIQYRRHRIGFQQELLPEMNTHFVAVAGNLLQNTGVVLGLSYQHRLR